MCFNIVIKVVRGNTTVNWGCLGIVHRSLAEIQDFT